MKKLIIFLAAMYTLSLAQAPYPGPPSAENDKGWLAFGFGRGFEHDFSAVVSANYGRVHILQLAFHGSEEFSIGDRAAGVKSIFLGYCFSSASRFTRAAFSAGPAIVFGKRRVDDRYKLDDFRTIGFEVNCQSIFTPLTEFGLGLDFYFNFNSKQNAGGVSLIIVLEGNK